MVTCLLLATGCKISSKNQPLEIDASIPAATNNILPAPTQTENIELISRDDLTVDDFYFLEYKMSYEEIKKHVGPADKDIGSGLYNFVYELKDGSVVLLVCSSSTDIGIFLISAHYQSPDGTNGIIVGPSP
jgi:hypothetical protein